MDHIMFEDNSEQLRR